jgi:hypothetical protein
MLSYKSQFAYISVSARLSQRRGASRGAAGA